MLFAEVVSLAFVVVGEVLLRHTKETESERQAELSDILDVCMGLPKIKKK